jgi:Protein of unknown function (DUF3135)
MKEYSNTKRGKLASYDVRTTPLGELQLPSFDELMNLARERPEVLEEMRQNLCIEVIQSAPNRLKERLEGLQFRIDMERRLAKSAVGACVRISSMMQDSLQELKQALNTPTEYLEQREIQTAEIIPFQRKEQA